jgi:hypothetical protein
LWSRLTAMEVPAPDGARRRRQAPAITGLSGALLEAPCARSRASVARARHADGATCRVDATNLRPDRGRCSRRPARPCQVDDDPDQGGVSRRAPAAAPAAPHRCDLLQVEAVGVEEDRSPRNRSEAVRRYPTRAPKASARVFGGRLSRPCRMSAGSWNGSGQKATTPGFRSPATARRVLHACGDGRISPGTGRMRKDVAADGDAEATAERAAHPGPA